MARDMKFTEDSRGILGILLCRVPEFLPHIHVSLFDVSALLLAQSLKNQLNVSHFSSLTTNSESVHGKEVLRGTRRQKAGKTIAILGLTFKP